MCAAFKQHLSIVWESASVAEHLEGWCYGAGAFGDKFVVYCFEFNFIANEWVSVWRLLYSNCFSLNAGGGVKTNLTVVSLTLHASWNLLKAVLYEVLADLGRYWLPCEQ